MNVKVALRKVKHEHTFYLLLVGNVVALAFLGLLVLRPAFGSLQAHTKEIRQTKTDIASSEQRLSELRKLKETFPIYQATYAPLLANMPKGKDIAGFQTELEELARLTSNQLLVVDSVVNAATKPGAPLAAASGGAGKTAPPAPAAAPPAASNTDANGFVVTAYKVDIVGTFPTVLDMVTRLESLSRFTKVTKLTLAGGDATGVIKATVEIQTLTLPEVTK